MRMSGLADDIRDFPADDCCSVCVGNKAERTRRGSLRVDRSAGKSNRRNSAVTFYLPDKSSSSSETQRDVFNSNIVAAHTLRRMSAPELPPIGDKNIKCKSPVSTDKSNFYSRMKNGSYLHRHNTEGSLKYSNPSPHSLSSESLSSYPVVGNNGNKTRSSDLSTGGDTGSTTKLQTLFEKNNNDSGVTNRMITKKPHSLTSKSRSESQDRVRSRMGLTETNNSQIVPIEAYANKTKPFLRRNKSEQKISAHKRQKNVLASNRTITVDNPNSFTKPFRHKSHLHSYKLKRYSSTPAINSVNGNSEQLQNGQLEDGEESENETERLERIFEWLKGVECSAENPQEPEIEYADEPPQTDTAVHVVYQG